MGLATAAKQQWSKEQQSRWRSSGLSKRSSGQGTALLNSPSPAWAPSWHRLMKKNCSLLVWQLHPAGKVSHREAQIEETIQVARLLGVGHSHSADKMIAQNDSPATLGPGAPPPGLLPSALQAERAGASTRTAQSLPASLVMVGSALALVDVHTTQLPALINN